MIVYLLILIVDISFVVSFSSIMKHHAHDLTVILTNKRDNLARLSEILTANGVKLDKKKVENIHNFDVKRIDTQDGEDAKAARNELTSLMSISFQLPHRMISMIRVVNIKRSSLISMNLKQFIVIT